MRRPFRSGFEGHQKGCLLSVSELLGVVLCPSARDGLNTESGIIPLANTPSDRVNDDDAVSVIYGAYLDMLFGRRAISLSNQSYAS